jgi:hypothetical protein
MSKIIAFILIYGLLSILLENIFMDFFGEDAYNKYPLIRWGIRAAMTILGLYCLVDASKNS